MDTQNHDGSELPCPLCDGLGWLDASGPGLASYGETCLIDGHRHAKCHECDGRGVVEADPPGVYDEQGAEPDSNATLRLSQGVFAP